MYAVGVLFCMVFLRERNSKRKRQGPPSPRERGRGRAKARTNTARKLTHRRCVLRVADRAKQTRSRAKSRSRRRSKARSTSTEEQRTKQHDIIEAQHDSEAKHVEHDAKAKHCVVASSELGGETPSSAALQGSGSHLCVFFFPLLPPVLLLVQATRRRPSYAHGSRTYAAACGHDCPF